MLLQVFKDPVTGSNVDGALYRVTRWSRGSFVDSVARFQAAIATLDLSTFQRVYEAMELERKMGASAFFSFLPGPRPEVVALAQAKPAWSPLLEIYDSRVPREDRMQTIEAIGLLETQGLVAALHATYDMLKSASVKLVGKEKIGAAYVTIMIRGDVAAVQAAIAAGKSTVERLGGKLILADVIPRPHPDLAALLPHMTACTDPGFEVEFKTMTPSVTTGPTSSASDSSAVSRSATAESSSVALRLVFARRPTTSRSVRFGRSAVFSWATASVGTGTNASIVMAILLGGSWMGQAMGARMNSPSRVL